MKTNTRRSALIAAAHLVLLACFTDCDKRSDAPSTASTAVSTAAPPVPPKPAKAPLKIAFSDWPGWTAFEIGIQKGWFKEAGVDVKFEWFEYTPSMEAFAAG